MRVPVIAAMVATLTFAPAAAQVPQGSAQGTFATAQPAPDEPERRDDSARRQRERDQVRHAVEGFLQSVLTQPPEREPPPREWSPLPRELPPSEPPPSDWSPPPEPRPVDFEDSAGEAGGVEPAAVPDPAPAKPAPAASVAPTSAVPAAPAPRMIRPRPTVAATPLADLPEPPTTAVAVAEPVVQAEPLEPTPRGIAPPLVTASPAQAAQPAPAATLESRETLSGWWLLAALAAAAAAVAGAVQFRRHRRLGRTRAALSLTPRLDLPMEASDATGPRFQAPPIAIRCRLEVAPDHG